MLIAILVLFVAGVVFSQALAAGAPAAAAPYRNLLTRQARLAWGLHAPVPAMAAQVQQESAWNPRAVSRVGARGLGQVMPATATWWCDRVGLKAAACQPHNPAWALRALAGYDKYLYDRAGKRFAHLAPFDRYWLALRGYNGGEAHVTAEAATTGTATPTVAQIDAACGRARRAKAHCAENTTYPRRILLVLQPRYAAWGPLLEPGK